MFHNHCEKQALVAQSSPTIRRHFGERRNDYGHFSAKYFENCRGITGIIPADLK